MSLLEIVAILLAGTAAGTINTVVGSGTLITFPTLLAFGVAPVTANVSNTIGLVPGSISGAIGYRRELAGQLRTVMPLAAVTAVGAVLGALALLVLPAGVFSAVAPVLVLIGCLLVGIQPLLRRRGELDRAPAPGWLRFPLTAATGVYGGYFGAAQGVLIVGCLELTMTEHIQRINAIKNVLQTLAGGVATVVFLFTATLPWVAVATIAVGSLGGALIGASVGRRLPAWLLRALIIVIGVVAVIFLVW